MKHFTGRRLGVIFAIFIVLSIAVTAAWAATDASRYAEKPRPSSLGLPSVFDEPTPGPPPPFSDQYFVQMAVRLALPEDGRDLFQRAQPIFADEIGLGPGLVGEVRGGQIRITSRFRTRTDTQAIKYVAHEYLHVVWYRMINANTYNAPGRAKKEEFTRAIDAVYKQHQAYFDEELKLYNTYFSDPSRGVTAGTERFYGEMHSLLGTEVADEILPPNLLAWYKRWLPNREILPDEFRG